MNEMRKVVLSVDAGKNCVKICHNQKVSKFENSVLDSDYEKKPSNGNSFEVIYQEKRYLVGDKVNSLKDYSSNKINNQNKIAIYTAIANVIASQKAEIEVQLVTGLPNEHYNEKNEEDLKDLLQGEINLRINNKEVKFSLKKDNILVMPECYSVDYVETPRTLLVDLGYRNANLNLLEYGNMISRHMKHSELGMHVFKTCIAEEFERKYRNNFKLQDITDYIVINGLPHDADSLELIRKGTIKYLTQLNNEMESKDFNLKTVNKLVFRGGGTNLIKKEHFEEVYPQYVKSNNLLIEGDEYKNVKIFSEVAEQYFGVGTNE